MSSVKLVSYTKCNEDYFGDEDENERNLQELIAFTARVSNPTNQMNKETSEKLINYCLKNKHWSIFDMVNATLEIETTRDIGRQILRHSSGKFQEFSQRYADPTQMEFVIRETRMQDEKNRQSSNACEDEFLDTWWRSQQEELIVIVKEIYGQALQYGIAKEVARAVLPEGLTPTKMYLNGTIRTWIHLIEVRTQPSTQKEFRIVANQCATEIAKVFPMITQFVAS